MTADEVRRQFRDVAGLFATGITLVTAERDGVFTGLTANSFCSVSLNPLLVLVCVDLTAESHPFIAQTGRFAVNILSDGQEAISRHFATKDPNKDAMLRSYPHRVGVMGCPILSEGLAYVECRVVNEVHAGDHTIFVGEVIEAGLEAEGEGLLFYRGKYRRLLPVDLP
jgi:flavin reductase (DIM6/NTAB) family NADH-FMN oxidoreductase RutF